MVSRRIANEREDRASLTVKIARDNLVSFEIRAIFALSLASFCRFEYMLILAFAESIQLFPDGTIFVHIGLILAMIWLLNRTFFRPINRVIESREKAKGGHGTEAENVLKKAGDKQAEYDKALLQARSQGYEIIEKEHAAAVADREQSIAAAKTELSERIAKEKADIAQQTAAARSVIASEADTMAEKIASNILKA